MSQRDDLIKLFIEENTFSCSILSQDRECAACNSRAEDLADNVLKVLGLVAPPEPVVTVQEMAGGGVYNVYVDSNIVGTVRKHTSGRWSFREPFHPSLGFYNTRKDAVAELVAAATGRNT